MEKKKSILKAFDGYVPPKEKPKPRYDVDELLGDNPGFAKRWAFYEHLKHEEEREKNK